MLNGSADLIEKPRVRKRRWCGIIVPAVRNQSGLIPYEA